MASHVSLMFSHISLVMEPRTARAFSRVDSKQLRMDDGCFLSHAKNAITLT